MADNFGAFVEIEHERLSREGLFLLGAREALDRWISKLRMLGDMQQHPGVGQVMREVADEMAVDRDEIAVTLTRQSIKDGAGKINELTKHKQ